jgi:hypothetical protein
MFTGLHEGKGPRIKGIHKEEGLMLAGPKPNFFSTECYKQSPTSIFVAS